METHIDESVGINIAWIQRYMESKFKGNEWLLLDVCWNLVEIIIFSPLASLPD